MTGNPGKLTETTPVSATFLATLSGISKRQVGVIMRDASVQRDSAGKFAIVPAVLALFAYERARRREDDDQDDSRSLLLATKAKLEELKLARELAKTVTVDAVMMELEPVLANFRAQVLTVPKKVAPILADGQTAGEREALITRSIYDALRELASLPDRLKEISPPSVEDDAEEKDDE